MEHLTDLSSLLLLLVLVGFLTEVIVEFFKDFLFKSKKTKRYLFVVSLVTSAILCFFLKVSLFDTGDTALFYIGIVICSLVASRGSNYIHNFIGNMPTKTK